MIVYLAERDGDGIAAGSLSALPFARAVAAAAGAPVTAVVFGPGPVPADLTGGGISVVRQVTSPKLAGYAPVAWARALQQLAEGGQATAVLAAATDRGAEVMAHLGAMTGLPVAANCLSGRPLQPGSWQLVRQRWAGSVLEDAVLEAPVALLTVAADAPAPDLDDPDAPGTAAIEGFEPELADADVLVQATEMAEEGSGVSLATARVVVGGGRGVGGPEGFAALEELAALLGGVVGVSRVVTSAGWRPHRQQVGQTGTKISPVLYLACGISGAIQHMAGCQNARHLIAVNTDPDAPIIARAEFAVIADLHELVPALIAAIKDRSGRSAATLTD